MGMCPLVSSDVTRCPCVPGAEWFFAALDTVIFCVYAFEAALKILALGSDYFRDFWNYVGTILENLKEVTGTFALSGRSLGAILLMMFTILYVSAPFWAISPHLGLSGSLRLLSVTLRVIFSVLLRDLFQRSDPQRFGDLFNTLFTLFQLFTLDDWSLIYQQSARVGYSYIIIFLMVYILIQYFTFLNLVIAVLIDNFQVSLLKEGEEKKQL
ncbi:PREDICTED: cation channel sperm-associated protein 1, partial [Tinamus guttatus]|uniref:cation channel sperm-associated protein 1 n=1 Tax=Tinamus guttatus TaxID=94827 RepID=UPI00052E6CD4